MSFATRFQDVLPVCFHGPIGRAYAEGVGQAHDAEAERYRLAVRARSPSRCLATGLDDLGTSYRLPRCPYELDDAYRVRLEQHLRFELAAGTLQGLRMVFAPFTGATYADPGEQPQVVPNWKATIDGLTDRVDRIFFVWDSELEADDNWGDPGVYDDGGLWGFAFDPLTGAGFGQAHLDWLRREVRSHKAAQALPIWIALSFAGADTTGLWDDGGLYDDGGDWGELDDEDHAHLPLLHLWGDGTLYGGTGDADGTWNDGSTWVDFVPPEGGW